MYASHNALPNPAPLIEQEGTITVNPARTRLFQKLGIEVPLPGTLKRPFAKCCLDWTERLYHISGPLGTLLMKKSLEAGWLERRKGSRALTINPQGLDAYNRLFGITAAELFEPGQS